MNSYARLAVAAVVVVAVGAMGLALLRPAGSTGPGGVVVPSATPIQSSTPAPSDAVASPAPTPVDTSAWVPYTSTRYGYTISRPASWQAAPAVRDATFTTSPATVPDDSTDHFIDGTASYQILVTGFAEAAHGVVTVDDWLNAYYKATTPDQQHCYSTIEIQPITIDGHVGKIATNDPCSTDEAFVLVDGRIYGFGVWRDGQEPLFRAFLSTIHFSPTGPAHSLPVPTDPPAPTRSLAPGWIPYHSSQYGFDIAYPAGWNAAPAQRAWTYATDATNWQSPAHDAFMSPDGTVRVSAWSVPIGSGETPGVDAQLATWVESFCQKTKETPCAGIPARAERLCLERRDCHPGLLVPFDQDTLAFFTGGIAPEGKVVVVAVWRPEADPSVAQYGGSQHLLEAFLSTMAVWPESTPDSERVVRDLPGPTPSPSTP